MDPVSITGVEFKLGSELLGHTRLKIGHITDRAALGRLVDSRKQFCVTGWTRPSQ